MRRVCGVCLSDGQMSMAKDVWPKSWGEMRNALTTSFFASDAHSFKLPPPPSKMRHVCLIFCFALQTHVCVSSSHHFIFNLLTGRSTIYLHHPVNSVTILDIMVSCTGCGLPLCRARLASSTFHDRLPSAQGPVRLA